MYKNLVVVSVCLLIIIPFFTGAQVTFQKTLQWGGHDIPMSAQQTSDGGYVITGTSGGYNIYLLKLDSVGDILFSKTYGGTGSDEGRSIQQTNDGGYIIAGFTSSWGSGGVYLVKTDESGNVEWSKMYEGAGGSSIQQTSDDGYIIAGFSSDSKIYLLKIDSIGLVDWSTTFDGPMAWYNVGSSVQQTTDGGYIITGSSNNPEWPLNDVSDVWLIKTDSIGSLLWAKLFVGGADEFAYCVQQTTDGGYIITGETWSYSFGITQDVFLIKTDSNGDTLWTRVYGGIFDDIGRSVQQTADGGYIIAGETTSFGGGDGDIYLIRTDSLGDTLWTRAYGGTSWDEGGYSVQETADGGFFVVGAASSFGLGIYDFYLIKTDSMGNSGGCNEYGTNTTVGYFSFLMFPQITIDSITTVDTNVITIVNNGSTNLIDQCDTTTGINQYVLPNNQFYVYPNPTSGLITVTGLPVEPVRITVYNVLGELVYGQELNGSNALLVDLSDLPGGIYLIQLQYEQMTFRKKVIKQ